MEILDDLAILTVERIGRTQEITPAGYLLCRDCVLGRTGVQVYDAREIKGLEPGKDGLIRTTVDDAVLFDPKTIASFNAAEVTDGHPPKFVTADSYKKYSRGTVLNVHRGTGADSDKLMGDLLIKDAATIQAVKDGLRGLSLGYDADYDQKEPGVATRTAMIGNHVALTRTPRSGISQGIGDSHMAATSTSWKEKLFGFVSPKDLSEFKKTLDEAPDMGGPAAVVHVHAAPATKDADPAAGGEKGAAGGDDPVTKIMGALAAVNDTLKTLTDRVTKLEGGKGAGGDGKGDGKGEAKGEGDGKGAGGDDGPPLKIKGEDDKDKGKTGDSTKVATVDASEIQLAKSRAEILIPGVEFPAFDPKDADAGKTLATFRRKVVKEALTRDSSLLPAGVAVTAETADALFAVAAETRAARNKAKTSTEVLRERTTFAAKSQTDITAVQKANQDFWTRKSA